MDNNLEKPIKVRIRERQDLRNKRIRGLYRAGYSMNEICKIEKHSKTTVYFAINGGRKINNKNNNIN